MPQEKTVPLPLSGNEIVVGVLDMVERALRSDCYLHPDSAYSFFEGHVTLELKLRDVPREAEDVVVRDLKKTHGEPDGKEKDHSITVKIEPEPPNQFRVETGQSVPTESGKRITYSRKVAQKVGQGSPENG